MDPGTTVRAGQASATSSRRSSLQKSSEPSGMASTRSGVNSRTKASSWLTTIIEPGQAASARPTASRDGGSRFVGGLVQQQEVVAPRHELGQGELRLLAS